MVTHLLFFFVFVVCFFFFLDIVRYYASVKT